MEKLSPIYANKKPVLESNFSQIYLGNGDFMDNNLPANTTSNLVDTLTSSFTGISKIADKVRDTEIKTALNGEANKVTNLLSTVLDLQRRQSNLQSMVDQLQAENSELEKKLTQKSSYRLKETILGKFIYVLKKESDTEEVPHAICPNCIKDDKIRILQRTTLWTSGIASAALDCPCGLHISLAKNEIDSIYE